MSTNPMQFQDCSIITKAYEKGCHSSFTEASVFAPLTSNLSFIRGMSSNVSKQMDAQNNTSSKFTLKEKEGTAAGITDTAGSVSVNALDQEAESFFAKIGNNFVPDGDAPSISLKPFSVSTGGIFDSECIPCDLRIKFDGELNLKASLSPIGDQMLQTLENWLYNAISQIMNIIDMFKNLDQYIDICAFFKFLKEFMCIPDLARMLAALMALMMDISFELGNIIDIVIAFVAPIFAPFLSNLIDILIKYLMAIIEPIECIVDSIQNVISKLDYNVLFQNVKRTDLSMGPKVGAPPNPQVVVTLPFLGALTVQDPAASTSDFRPRAVETNLTPLQKAQANSEQARVDKAIKNLEKLRKASGNVDGSNAAAVAKYKEQEKVAVQEYRDALQGRDLSAIGRSNLQIEKFQSTFKSTFLELITFLKEAAFKFNSFVNSIFTEFKKLLNEYVGASGNYLSFAGKKLAILQMIAFIKSIIEFLKRDLQCNDENEELEVVLDIFAKESSFNVFTDENGDIYIEEDIDGISDLADALGRGKGSFGGVSKDDLPSSAGRDLRSLLEYTGDDIIDGEISKALENLTIPQKIKIDCRSRVSVEDADKINTWIEELTNE